MREITEKTPNPQGKGLVPVLAHLHQLQPSPDQTSHPHAVLMRYLFSRLVLKARFAFQPTRGQRYTLYWYNETALLSMINPKEFGGEWPSRAVADCILCNDLTWECLHLYSASKLSEMAQLSPEIVNTNTPLKDTLPYYDASLPFNQRALAYGMSHGVAQQLHELTQLTLPTLLAKLEQAPSGALSVSSFITQQGAINE